MNGDLCRAGRAGSRNGKL